MDCVNVLGIGLQSVTLTACIVQGMSATCSELILAHEISDDTLLVAAILTARKAHTLAGSPLNCTHSKMQRRHRSTGSLTVYTTCTPER